NSDGSLVWANRVAKWDGRNWSALDAGLGGTVSALMVSGSDLYAGGLFTTTGGTPANHIAKWNGSGWSALGLGLNNDVMALAISGTDLYVGGIFTMANDNIPVNYIAKWNGSAWSPVGAGMNGWVVSLAVSGNVVYAGGAFTRATNSGGVAVPANNIAKWNGSSWAALGLGLYNGGPSALVVSGSDLYAGGLFYG